MITPAQAAAEVLRRQFGRNSLVEFAQSIDVPGKPGIVFGGAEAKKELNGGEQEEELEARPHGPEAPGLSGKDPDGHAPRGKEKDAEYCDPEQGTGQVM